MVPSPGKCPGIAGKVCNRFLPARDNDPHRLCTSCQGETCNIDDRCEDCHDWTDDMWHCLGEYLPKLSVQWSERRRREQRLLPPLLLLGFSPLCLYL